jgi:predicted  nucleic acid-binding Zn-ribbon protein
MTQSREPEENDLSRAVRRLDRRVRRLEDTQVPASELNDSFNRVYDEMDALEEQIDRRFDSLEAKMDRQYEEMNLKFATIMRHLTGEGNNPIL